jgi:hypothetical protein
MAGLLTVDTIQSDSSYASTLNVASKMNFTSGMQIGGQDATFGGMRNRIINGDMRIDQRALGTVSASGNYVLDRFLNYRSGGAYSVQQSTDAPAGFTNSMLMTNTTTASPTTYSFFGQVIEGNNIADLNFGTANASAITVSFWVKSSVVGVYSISITNGNGDRAYPATYTINNANTWEKETITIPGDTTGTWATNNTSGLFLRINLGSPSSRTAAAGSWVAGNYDGANGSTGATTWANTLNATFYVTGVQLEKGSAATAFENRQFGQELALCQRYYEIGGNNAPTQVEGGGTNVWISIQYKVNKRATPTFALTSASNLALRYYGTAGYAVTGAAFVTGYIGTTSAMVRYSGFSSLTTSASMFTSGTTDATPTVDPFSISAEL